ncbi:response regulator transcription factor [Clostridium botulinum]|uniref:Stage 0 sporulation protein A homolog n=1 Tax=Clostridium botulinum (strain Eklund 17B / Type B) TaxID=935198 RepID=B2TRX5_CLOBB|nr:putative lantibiotic biosynthesis regulatory protein [Clostridium botulinum B str. Eklund 17B (NRP)]MBY6976860.1 response regulator transcription factor [Clostridium botulinum]MBY7002038.1 response regulator transcription factor [Clostridium botulinum]MCR1272909.1 response regulator transcription factor [Clostridium botulinum]NFD69732.1 response regulator transcription factor [Clostridium botulinum]
MATILAIDDEIGILNIIKVALEKEGHIVTTVSNANEISYNQYTKYDLILLDIMMPEIDGFTLCNKIRSLVDCPILFLTAKTMEEDIVKGLSFGGDDYITKPFGISELRARVNAHLRRERREKQNAFYISELKFYINSKEVYHDEELISFTKSEYNICEYLALNHGQVFSKEQIYESVFGFDGHSDTTAIVEHIKNIRSKLKVRGINTIETVWGIGYKWKE